MDVEGTSDIFVKAWIDEKNPEETDTHWRCRTGSASFNWRMLFNIKAPSPNKFDMDAYVLKLQIYDRDVIGANEFICQFDLDLRLLIEDVMLTQRPMHLNKDYFNKFFG